ncbi:type I-E CRISPR-associated protein Cas5/CasD [Streptomyces sp. NPDC051976]|uniref:type I-E CRISPR-associated protein Cas5/CasD n=1 Tax=Streptomyces sp. NPDC051976 TaxID=3154947 RepID=UPI003426C9CE
MSRGLVLRLAGVMQAWGESAAFTYRDTAAHPTRSALIGMFAAASGRTREQALDPYPDLRAPGQDHAPSHRDLVFTIRIDNPGTVYRDFQTAGGGRPHQQGLRTAAGNYRPQDESTMVTWRDYLVGAAFTLAVQGPPALLAHIAATLERPVYSPYLGRRSCLPDEPLIIHADITDPVRALRSVPLTLARPPAPGAEFVLVTFLHEHPPGRPAQLGDLPHLESPSEPVDFTSSARTHLLRPLWRTTEPLPADRYAGRSPATALTDYILSHPAAPATG